MKNIGLIIGSLFMMAMPMHSRVIVGNYPLTFVSAAPSGSCSTNTPVQYVFSGSNQGQLCTCNGTWQCGLPGAGTVSGLTNGTTAITGGTNGYILYNANGVLGNLATTGSGPVVRATAGTLTTPIINGTSSGTGVSQTGGPGTIAQRDGYNNLVANNFLGSGTVVTAAAGTTTLTVGSSRYQFLTGSTTQTFQLPSATTVTVGTSFWFNNNSTGTMTINNGSGSLITTVPPTGMVNVVLQVAGSTAGTWDWHYLLPTNATLFANLPSCSTTNASLTFWITDSSTQVWGATVTGTGTPATPYTFIGCDGVNWTVIGK